MSNPVLALALPERCYRCGTVTNALVGLLVDPAPSSHRVFRDFDEIAELVADQVPHEELQRLRIGAIKPRRSRQRGVYLSNGCCACDAILGSFPLREHLLDFLLEGGRLRDLGVASWSLRIADRRPAAESA